MARLDAERRLKDAEESLTRLERAVNKKPGDETRDETEVREEMIGDVKTLKRKIIYCTPVSWFFGGQIFRIL